jgi:hypothetical protein
MVTRPPMIAVSAYSPRMTMGWSVAPLFDTENDG